MLQLLIPLFDGMVKAGYKKDTVYMYVYFLLKQ